MFTVFPRLASLAAIALAMPVAASEPQTRTRTHEGPRASAVQTTTIDPATGTATRESAVTNLATGNTATSSAVRQRTETGASLAVQQTGPQGRTRSLAGERTRTENGATFAGTATGRGGQTYGLAGSRSRDGEGNAQVSQSVTDSTGQTLAARARVTTRGNGQVSSTITRSRAEGVSRPPRMRGPRR